MTSSELTGPVHVIGAGLLGTSIGLAVRAAGLPVWLSDANPEHLRTAVSLGAGEPRPDEGAAQLVVVAVPPLSIAEVVLDALSTGAVVTDIGGLMSHAAIVCREYGVPAVTGTGSATENIQTGDLIRVDGNGGKVTKL